MAELHLALGIVGAVYKYIQSSTDNACKDLLIKFSYGKLLIETIETLKDAKAEISERVVEVKAQWLRTRVQLDFIQKIWASLSPEHQAIQTEILGMLVTRLRSAVDKLSKLLKPQNGPDEGFGVKRWKYLLLKPYLDEAIQKLAKWQQLYDTSWYLIMRVASPAIDVQLTQEQASKATGETGPLKTATQIRAALKGDSPRSVHVFLPSAGLKDALTLSIPLSSARHVRKAGTSKWLIIDSIFCLQGTNVNNMAHELRRLATKLLCADPPTFNILRCRGLIKITQQDRVTAFDMVFETPTADRPRTLRSCLLSHAPHNLTERFELAKQVARSVNYVHTLDFVHKNVRPENFVGFGGNELETSFNGNCNGLGSFFLLGFGQVRKADGNTFLQADEAWEKNIYRHPDRQGLYPDEIYCMQHDIYSLGVCLLEIGLWQSFVEYGDDGVAVSPTPALGLTLEEVKLKSPRSLKGHLVSLAKDFLAPKMGMIYAEIVLNCLTCLDEDNDNFGDEKASEKENSISIGVKFIEKARLPQNSVV